MHALLVVAALAAECRLFVEKAAATAHAHHIEEVNLFLKSHVGFDARIERIAFRGRYKLAGREPEAYEQEVRPYLDAQDFWEVDIPVTAHNNSGVYVEWVEGQFHVLTEAGTDYVLAADGGRDFVLNEELFGNLERVMRDTGLHGQWQADYMREVFPYVSPDTAVWAKWNFPYLNPGGCE